MGYIASMNHIDIIIIAFTVFMGIRGYISGFAISAVSLFKYAASIAVTSMYYGKVAQIIRENPKAMLLFMAFSKSVFSGVENQGQVISKAANLFVSAASVALVFIMFNIAVGIAMTVADGFLKIKPVDMLNRLAGFLLGCIKGLIIIMLLFVVINPFAAMNPDGEIAASLNNSLLAKYFYMYNFIFKYFDGFIEIFNGDKLG